MKLSKMRSVKYPIAVPLFFLFIISCGKIEKLPPEPSIKFRSFEIFDSIDMLGNDVKGGRLNFYFEDGDGDLGLPAPNMIMTIDSTNLFFRLYRKTGGAFVPAANNDPLKPSSYRIPFMDRQGQNKILKGNIGVTFLYLFYSSSDTIMYKFFIKDRAEHLSDTASTCEIVLVKNGVCYNPE
jgi:hypothetical protein